MQQAVYWVKRWCVSADWGPPWSPPLEVKQNCGYNHVLGGLLCHHSEMELAQRANKIAPHLFPPTPTPPSPDQPCLGDGFFCCFVCLLVWSGAHGYPAWSTESRSRGMEDVEVCVEEERRPRGGRGWCGGRGSGYTTGRAPLEVTRDLPRSHRAKLLNKYTQTYRITPTDTLLSLILQQMLFLKQFLYHSLDLFKLCMTILNVCRNWSQIRPHNAAICQLAVHF